MFCKNCGAEVNDGAEFCPACHAQLNTTVGQTASMPQPEKKAENVHGKGYAAIASSLFVFPTLICLAFDYLSKDNKITWSAYVLGIAMCLWMFIVLPALKPKRPGLTACVCIAVISLYLTFLAYVNQNAGIYIKYILPMCLMLTVSSAVLSLLISYKVLKNEHIISAVFAQGGLLLVGFEILFDIQRRGVVSLRWSIITSVIAISAIAINEAISYSMRLKNK